MSDMALRLAGYRMSTVEILYYLPDNPSMLQTFIWQTLDIAPKFPRILRFLDFWHREIDGRLHTVTVAHADLVKPTEYRYIDGGIFRLQ